MKGLTRRGLFAWFGGGAALAVVAPAARSSVITRPGLSYVTVSDVPIGIAHRVAFMLRPDTCRWFKLRIGRWRKR